jgi:hypothetical protein
MLKYERQICEIYYNNATIMGTNHIGITQVKNQKANMIARIKSISHNNEY